MYNKIDKVRKIVGAVINTSSVHGQHNFIKFEDETVSTYDGMYPSFELMYKSEGNNLWLSEHKENLITTIMNYTGLRYGTDYWLGVSVEN